MTPRPTPDIVMWMDAIGQADLKSPEKSVLYALLRWANWKTGGDCYPSVKSIAQYAGLTDRAVPDVLKRLEARGVVQVVNRSRGGVNKRGRGIVNRYRLDRQALERMNPERGSGLNPEPDALKPGTPHAETLNVVRENTEPGSDKHPEEQPGSTTTTKSGGAGGGGGGHGDSFSPAENQDARIPPADQAESRRLLLDFGVSAGVAAGLAQRHPPAEIEAGIAWVLQQGARVNSRPGLLVKASRDGTAADIVRRVREAEMNEQRERAEGGERQRFAEGLTSVLNWAAENGRTDDVGCIRRAWPDLGDAARSGIVTNSEVNDLYATECDEARATAAGHALINRLAGAARETVASRQAERERRRRLARVVGGNGRATGETLSRSSQ